MLLGVLASTAAGCAGFSEALRDRTGWEFGGQPPTVEFGCERPLLRSEKRLSGEGEGARPIIVEAAADPDRVLVGKLKAGMYDIPLFVSGPRPNEVLRRDVQAELRRRGLAVDGEAPTANLTLHVGVTMIGTDWLPGHWYQFTRTLRGQLVFRAALRRGAESLWSRTFEAQDEARYRYDLASNHAKLLGEAYCRCLEQFDQALDGPEFEGAVRGVAAGETGS